ncbi:DUF6461 domain-containing protein [Actinoplanes sp. KI2]|uniref:DUF6461 domain-containing protein n=1 Tax=Actinoplanes sp. KI2 TaxID=2983315 RepID=UPI0021D5F506|nr:DUF6461 domain-containing protein [Actinoplanes sp. KI2]MCU7728414.1 DUF6461 domain-containing protein [Actinoplanes sp. KI2]
MHVHACLTFVRGLGPDEVVSRLGGADPVSIVSAEAAVGASEAVQERVDEGGATHPSGLDYVAVTQAGDWVMIIEPNGFLCTDDAVVQGLSSAGEMVSFYYNENTTPRFFWAVDGRELVGFDPGFPSERSGSDRTRLDRVLAELGFVLEPDAEAYDDVFRERTLALMARVTGVHWDAEFLEHAMFRCAGVGGLAALSRWSPGMPRCAKNWRHLRRIHRGGSTTTSTGGVSVGSLTGVSKRWVPPGQGSSTRIPRWPWRSPTPLPS